MLISGTIAVFRTKVEAGPAALITIGAVLVVIAAGGRAVAHFKVGDAEVDMLRREEARAEVEESLEEESPEVALARVETASLYDPDVLAMPNVARLSTEAFEKLMLSRLHILMPEANFVEQSPDMGFDILASKGDKSVPILIQFASLSSTQLKLLANEVSATTSFKCALAIVAAEILRPGVRERLRELRRLLEPQVRIVRWRSPADDVELADALRQALGDH